MNSIVKTKRDEQKELTFHLSFFEALKSYMPCCRPKKIFLFKQVKFYLSNPLIGLEFHQAKDGYQEHPAQHDGNRKI